MNPIQSTAAARPAVGKWCGAAALAFSLSLSLTACGGGNGSATNNAATTPAASQPDAGASTPAVAKAALHCAP